MDCPVTLKMVLDEDEETKEVMVQVHKKLVTKLKPHQVEGEKLDTITISRLAVAQECHFCIRIKH